MYDLVSVGNISVDLFFQGESLTHDRERFQLAIGGKYFTDKAVQTVGGGGANVAIGVAKHKLNAAVLGTIGNNPFKKTILDVFEKAHVSTSLCGYQDNFMNMSAILLTQKGEKTVVHYSTPHQHILKNSEDRLYKTKLLYMGNIPDVSIYERTRFLTKAKKAGIKRFVNLGIKDCRLPKNAIRPFLEEVDVLIVNGHEFAELVKAPYDDIHFHEDVVSWYIPHLKETLVIVTEGKRGSYAYYRGHIHHQEALPIEHMVDATGAGDGFTAGFIAGFCQADDIRTAMKSGASYAVKILSRIGANES